MPKAQKKTYWLNAWSKIWPNHSMAAIGQVWTRQCRFNRACPTAFIALSVHHMFVRPLALLVFQTALDSSGLYRLGTLLT